MQNTEILVNRNGKCYFAYRFGTEAVAFDSKGVKGAGKKNKNTEILVNCNGKCCFAYRMMISVGHRFGDVKGLEIE